MLTDGKTQAVGERKWGIGRRMKKEGKFSESCNHMQSRDEMESGGMEGVCSGGIFRAIVRL